MKLLVSLAVLGLTTIMAAPIDPSENDLFNSSEEYDADCVEGDVQAGNADPDLYFEGPAAFKDEFENEDDCEDFPAEGELGSDLDNINLGDINDEAADAAPKFKDVFEAPAFQENDDVLYNEDYECEDEEIEAGDADDDLFENFPAQKDEAPADDLAADCYDDAEDNEDALDIDLGDAPMKDDYFNFDNANDFDNILDNAQRAEFQQDEILEEDCVDEEVY